MQILMQILSVPGTLNKVGWNEQTCFIQNYSVARNFCWFTFAPEDSVIYETNILNLTFCAAYICWIIVSDHKHMESMTMEQAYDTFSYFVSLLKSP